MKGKNLRRYGILVLLALAVTVSGCNSITQSPKEEQRETADEVQQKTQKLQTCGRISIDIVDASASDAVIQQNSGEQPVGELEVTWTLQNGEKATDKVSIEDRREVVRAANKLEGTLEEVVAKSTKCDGVEATYR